MRKCTTLRYDRGQIVFDEVNVPDPGPGQVQVENIACGICSWDIATCRDPDFVVPAPAGHEGVGIVRSLGAGVTGLREGDRIAGGGFVRFYNVDAARIAGHAVRTSDVEPLYWLVEPVSCVVTSIDLSRLLPGYRVAVIGCGFMGLTMLQVLRHYPLDLVVAIDIDDAKLTLAERFGAYERVNPRGVAQADVIEQLRPREFDVVIETSGTQSGLDLATGIVRRAGLVNIFGWLKGTTATFNPTRWHLEGLTLINSTPSAQVRDPFPAAIRLLERGIVDLKPLVTDVVYLRDYPLWMQRRLTDRRGYIKGVVRLDEKGIVTC